MKFKRCRYSCNSSRIVLLIFVDIMSTFEPQRLETYRRSCTPKEYSNQPAHSRSLIRVFFVHIITKTYLYNFDPLKPHFYIVKLGFTGVHYFAYFCKNHRLWVLAEAVLTSTHNLCFEKNNEKYQNLYLKTSRFWW